jgi:hypothetical protein
VARFYASIFHKGPSYCLVATRANGQLAFGAYLRAPPVPSATEPGSWSSPSPATG